MRPPCSKRQKAVNNRVKTLTTLDGDGAGLMGVVFSTDKPHLVLGDLSTRSGQNIQEGFRFLFMGALQAIRNQSAHEPFEEIDEAQAFEHLGLASLLMRKLDTARKP